MRTYSVDSPDALARLITLALVADGSVHRDELDAITREEWLQRIGIDDDRFGEVYCEFHEDLLARGERRADGSIALDMKAVTDLLGDICRPELQMMMFRGFLEIANADGIVTGAEAGLLADAMKCWNIDLFADGDLGIPMRRSRAESAATL